MPKADKTPLPMKTCTVQWHSSAPIPSVAFLKVLQRCYISSCRVWPQYYLTTVPVIFILQTNSPPSEAQELSSGSQN